MRSRCCSGSPFRSLVRIVSRVRSKVGHITTTIPASDATLRQDKGIVVHDLLKVLSLSQAGYEALKRGESKDTVKTLSRLQRYVGITASNTSSRRSVASRPIGASGGQSSGTL